MISLQNKLKQIGTALNETLPGIVFHYFSPQTLPYCVWAEEGEGETHFSDNKHSEQVITGNINYYTQTEYDANIDAIQTTLEEICDAWTLSSVLYEENQKLIHYSWSWEIVNYG